MQAYAATIEKPHKRISMTSKKFNINYVTVKKYLNMTASEIQSLDNPKIYKKRQKPVGAANHLNIIYKMIRDKHQPEIIYWYVISKGFNGTQNQLEHAIACIANNNFKINISRLKLSQNYSKGSIVIKRNDLLKEITVRDSKYKHNKIIQENFGLIYEKYPIVKVVNDLYSSFYSTIMGDKPNKLDEFIQKYETKKEKDENGEDKIVYQSPIPSFIEGLKKDIPPIKNAISFSESSGFVEGNNCKFKLVKRILYGRANLVNLFRKCYLCFSMKMDNFSLNGSYSLAKEK